mmetsp:Transcript_34426/g.72495  ORF Transcript_34426/g.72495 Transcript_34426/m.72495 type:complete len:223 (+) Transcript_34426:138-806(+)
MHTTTTTRAHTHEHARTQSRRVSQGRAALEVSLDLRRVRVKSALDLLVVNLVALVDVRDVARLVKRASARPLGAAQRSLVHVVDQRLHAGLFDRPRLSVGERIRVGVVSFGVADPPNVARATKLLLVVAVLRLVVEHVPAVLPSPLLLLLHLVAMFASLFSSSTQEFLLLSFDVAVLLRFCISALGPLLLESIGAQLVASVLCNNCLVVLKPGVLQLSFQSR